MGESKKYLRFGIVQDKKRAATWNIRQQVNSQNGLPEVYVFCRELEGSIHISLHSTGQWHITYSEEFFTKNSEIQNKQIIEWEKPAETKEGITLALKIITPYSAVKEKSSKDHKEIIDIQNAPVGKATEILIILIAPDFNYEYKNFNVIGKLELCNKENLVILSHVINIPKINFPKNKINPAFLKGRSFGNLLGKNLKVLIFGDSTNGVVTLLDCTVKLGWKVKLRAVYLKLMYLLKQT